MPSVRLGKLRMLGIRPQPFVDIGVPDAVHAILEVIVHLVEKTLGVVGEPHIDIVAVDLLYIIIAVIAVAVEDRTGPFLR